MKQSAELVLVFLFLTQFGFAVENHQAKENIVKKRQVTELETTEDELLATLGEVTSPSGYRQLYIYSSQKLSEVEYKVGEAENWSPMSKAISSSHEAYGSKNFLPSAPGQKYTVRSVRPDGTRVTNLLEIDSKDEKIIIVKKLKEESKAEVDAQRKITPQSETAGASNVLTKALNSMGRCLGNGTCAALAGGARLGQISGGNSYLQVQPGEVLRFSPGSSFNSSMGRFNVSSQGHYVVVESINPDGTFTFLHQNWAGGSSQGKTVRRDTGNLRTLNGSATIYSGN